MSSDEALFPAHSQAPPSRGCCNPPQAPHRLRSLSPSAWTHCACVVVCNRFVFPDCGKSAARRHLPPRDLPLLAFSSCRTVPPRQSCRRPRPNPARPRAAPPRRQPPAAGASPSLGHSSKGSPTPPLPSVSPCQRCLEMFPCPDKPDPRLLQVRRRCCRYIFPRARSPAGDQQGQWRCPVRQGHAALNS